MKLKSKSAVSIIAALCLFASTAAGCNTATRTPQTPNQAGTTQLGQNMVGTTPRQGTGTLPNGSYTGMQGITPGTGNNQRIMGNRGGIQQNQAGTGNLNGTRLNQQITTPVGFDSNKAENIRKKLVNMNGVNDPNVIVNGNTALVGYKTSPGTNANGIKNSITNTIKQMDNTITNVVATDSAKVGTAINRLAADIKNNKPINGLRDSFNKIMQSITPNASK